MNIFAKGSFTYDEGRIFLWNNPFLFIPMSSFAILQKRLLELFHEDGAELIYRIGKIQGKNSTNIFIKRFGFTPSAKNFASFVDGATLVGMGTCKLVSYDLTKNIAVIQSEDSHLANVYLSKFGVCSTSVDHYLRGIIAGGAEPINNITLGCDEKYCIGKGDRFCEYVVFPTSEEKDVGSLSELTKKANDFINVGSSFVLKRKGFLQNMISKSILKFENGKIFINGINGIIIPTYLVSILNYLLWKNTSSSLDEIYSSVAKDYLVDIKYHISSKPSITMINSNLNQLDFFGFGQSRVVRYVKKRMVIENLNNPYPLDFQTLFGIQSYPVDIILKHILEEYLKKIFDCKIKIDEVQCVSSGNKKCIFNIDMD